MELQTELSSEEEALLSESPSQESPQESPQESLDLGLEDRNQESLDSEASEEADLQEEGAGDLKAKETLEVEIIEEPSESEVQEQLKQEIEKDLPDPDQVFKTLDDEVVQSWNGFDDIDLNKIPEAFHAPMEKVVSIAQSLISEHEEQTARKQSEYEAARQQLLELADGIQEEGLKGASVVQKFEEQSNLLDALNNDVVTNAWRGFSILRPDYANLPNEVKDTFNKYAFGGADGADGMLHRMPGDTLIDKLNAVLDFTLYRSGYSDSGSEVASSPQSTTQALVNGGEVASAVPVRSVDEMNYNEIMSRYDHLLTE